MLFAISSHHPLCDVRARIVNRRRSVKDCGKVRIYMLKSLHMHKQALNQAREKPASAISLIDYCHT